MALLIVILLIVWLFFIFKGEKEGKERQKQCNIKRVNNLGYIEGVIYPVHIKYKMLDKSAFIQNSNYSTFYNRTYSNYVRNSPIFKCVVDGKVITTISMGQETELDIAPGEHIIYFESNVIRNKNFLKYIKINYKTKSKNKY